MVAAQGGTRHALSETDIGKRVTVTNFGPGVLRFFGPHHRDGKPRCGVELDEATGINNGTVGVSRRKGVFFYWDLVVVHL